MTVLIILSYWEGFRSAKFPLFIENIVMLIVALSGRSIWIYIVIPGILLYQGSLYGGSSVSFQNYGLFYLQTLWPWHDCIVFHSHFLIDCNISTAYCWSSSDVGVNQQFNTTVDEDNQYAVKLSEKPWVSLIVACMCL